eukprot:GHVR01106364.1.p1 GENE.GHVR01106364.1~~GHVR01106364.1.p1  ORF type:complete len:239 (+),score=42.14 GHVR01106364.1:34-750(+)
MECLRKPFSYCCEPEKDVHNLDEDSKKKSGKSLAKHDQKSSANATSGVQTRHVLPQPPKHKTCGSKCCSTGCGGKKDPNEEELVELQPMVQSQEDDEPVVLKSKKILEIDVNVYTYPEEIFEVEKNVPKYIYKYNREDMNLPIVYEDEYLYFTSITEVLNKKVETREVFIKKNVKFTRNDKSVVRPLRKTLVKPMEVEVPGEVRIENGNRIEKRAIVRVVHKKENIEYDEVNVVFKIV